MSFMNFIRKQFVDVIQWTEERNNDLDSPLLSYRFPLEDNEIQYGGSLTVRESQVAVFVNEGKIADVFIPGMYTLTTQTLPVLTYLKNWDKLFNSPFKSDVYFLNTRKQLDNKWGTPQMITLRDKEFGAVRLRAFGNYAYHIADPKLFFTQIVGTQDIYTVADIEGQLRGMILENISTSIANSGVPFLDLAANQRLFSNTLSKALSPLFAEMGLQLDSLTVQNVSLPDELQRILDQKIGMGIIGNDMGKLMQFQVAQSIPTMSENSGASSVAGSAMGLGAGLSVGQMMAQQFQAGLSNANATPTPVPQIKPEEIFMQLEKMAELKTKGILTDEEFNDKKAELLKKL